MITIRGNHKDIKLAKISRKFERTVRKKYPFMSMYEITLELNKRYEELIYGAILNETKNKKKRKHN